VGPQLPIHNVLRLPALRCRMQINYRKRKKRKRGMQIIILMVEWISLSRISFRLPHRTTFENISTSLLHRCKLRAASCRFNSIRPFRLLACRLFTLHSSSPRLVLQTGTGEEARRRREAQLQRPLARQAHFCDRRNICDRQQVLREYVLVCI
jgi:hypothetical protein